MPAIGFVGEFLVILAAEGQLLAGFPAGEALIWRRFTCDVQARDFARSPILTFCGARRSQPAQFLVLSGVACGSGDAVAEPSAMSARVGAGLLAKSRRQAVGACRMTVASARAAECAADRGVRDLIATC